MLEAMAADYRRKMKKYCDEDEGGAAADCHLASFVAEQCATAIRSRQ